MREVFAVCHDLWGGIRDFIVSKHKLIFPSLEEYQRIGKLLIEGLENRGDTINGEQSDYTRQTRAANNGWATSDEARKKIAEFNGIKKACFGACWTIIVG